MSLLAAANQPDFVAGNQLVLLNNGDQYFPALLDAIQAAQQEIRLETYIFADDGTGRAVASALAYAAQRGVDVYLLVDGFGARDFVGTLMPALIADGVNVMIYRQEIVQFRPLFRLRRHRLRRLHRKLAVIDGSVAFIGGINIIADNNTPHQTPPRYDYAVRIRGPLLAAIHQASCHLWELMLWARLKHRHPPSQRLLPDTRPAGNQCAAFLIRDNIRHRRDIEQAYLAAIDGAQQQIMVASAYFLPGKHFRHALINAAKRGVNVTILLQGKVEYRLLHYATQALCGSLFSAGIHIHEYRKSFMHAKVAVIDDEWATVGSSNIDPFSLLLARESNVVIKDRLFTSELRASLQQALADGSAELLSSDWQHRAWYERLLRWLSYGLVRLMIGMAGYGASDSNEHSAR